MDGFINFLDEYKTLDDEKIITSFKEKLSEQITYKEHLEKYTHTEEWFSTLDSILVELGYRALDADIEIIRTEIRKKILINVDDYLTIQELYKNKEFIKWALDFLPYEIDWMSISNNDEIINFVIEYLILNPDKIDIEKYRINWHNYNLIYIISNTPHLSDTKKFYLNTLKKHREERDTLRYTEFNINFPNFDKWDTYLGLRLRRIHLISSWKLYEFGRLNWLPLSRLKIEY